MTGKSWIGALTGLAFVVLAIVCVAVGGGEPPNPTDDSVEEIVEFYVDNDSSIWIAAIGSTIAATLLVFFGGYLRMILREAEGEGHTLSTVTLAGATILAIAIAVDAMINIALVESVEDIEPGATQALSALWSNDFLPIALGGQVFTLAAGISIVRHGALPKWLGWVAIVIGVLAVTPVGFFAFLAAAIWIAVVSIMLALRARAGNAAQPAA